MKKNRMKKMMMNLYFFKNMSDSNMCFMLFLNYIVQTEVNSDLKTIKNNSKFY